MQSFAEKRTALELVAFERCIGETKLFVRWGRSEAKLSDGLTNATAHQSIDAYMRTGCWALVDDDEPLNAKNHKERGLTSFKTTRRADFACLIRKASKHTDMKPPGAVNGGDGDDRE